jgi:hypothetical protein
MLDTYFEALNTINEWVSFEMNYPRKPEVQFEIDLLEDELPEIYRKALEIICGVLHACTLMESDSKWENSRQ